MLRSNKGFTIIELIVSFIFTSILAITLFSVILNYRNRAMETEKETELLAFVNKLKIDIQKDIDTKLLKSMDNCYNGTDIIEKCAILTFDDNSKKTFKVEYTFLVEEIKDSSGKVIDDFNFRVPHISYGGIKYNIPDSHNITIRSDFMFEKTIREDALETNTPLYKLNVIMSHKDLEDDIIFKLVASGTTSLIAGVTPPYKAYNIGDVVTVQLNSGDRRRFRVIKNSNGYSSYMTLLYDDASLAINTHFNHLEHRNEYFNSLLAEKFNTLTKNWSNARSVRPITADEIAYIINLCPQYRQPDSPNVSLSTAPSWLTSSTYWTSSKKEYSNANQGKNIWIVNSSTKRLEARQIDGALPNSVRPVIEISKIYDITT